MLDLNADEPGAQDLLTVEQRAVYMVEYHRVEGEPSVKHAHAWYKAVIDG